MVAEKIQAKGAVQNQVAKPTEAGPKEKPIRGQRGSPSPEMANRDPIPGRSPCGFPRGGPPTGSPNAMDEMGNEKHDRTVKENTPSVVGTFHGEQRHSLLKMQSC